MPGSAGLLEPEVELEPVEPGDVWVHVFAFGRVFSPMLLLLGMRAVARGDGVLLAPLVLTLPRTLAEFAPQVLGAAR